jgi:hypothetical protein
MNDLTITKEELVRRATSQVQSLIKDVPNPTQAELRKLLAVQGTILNQVGIELLMDARGSRKPGNRVSLALKALSASREALKASANIVDPGIGSPQGDQGTGD